MDFFIVKSIRMKCVYYPRTKAFTLFEKNSVNISRWIILFIILVSIYIITSGVIMALLILLNMKDDSIVRPLLFSKVGNDIPNFKKFDNTKKAKLVIAEAISISLGFLLSASLIQQTITPDYYHLGILGVLIILHLFIGYNVNQEINNAVNQTITWGKLKLP